MNCEIIRVRSFTDKFPAKFLDVNDLASAGLYFTQFEDYVACFSCGVLLHSWRKGDDPLLRHYKFSPRCTFLNDENVKNVPRNESMRFEEERLRTFSHGFPSKYTNIRELARAGFYYYQNKDCVICFACSGQLYAWEEYDIPWEEHRKKFPTCKFVLGEKCGNVEHDLNSEDIPPSSKYCNQAQYNTTEEKLVIYSMINALEKEIEKRNSWYCTIL